MLSGRVACLPGGPPTVLPRALQSQNKAPTQPPSSSPSSPAILVTGHFCLNYHLPCPWPQPHSGKGLPLSLHVRKGRIEHFLSSSLPHRDVEEGLMPILQVRKPRLRSAPRPNAETSTLAFTPQKVLTFNLKLKNAERKAVKFPYPTLTGLNDFYEGTKTAFLLGSGNPLRFCTRFDLSQQLCNRLSPVYKE